MFTAIPRPQTYPQGISIDYFNDRISVTLNGQNLVDPFTLALYNVNGMFLGSCRLPGNSNEVPLEEVTKSSLIDGNLYLVIVSTGNFIFSRKIVYSGLQRR
jgi:hypothetical protein